MKLLAAVITLHAYFLHFLLALFFSSSTRTFAAAATLLACFFILAGPCLSLENTVCCCSRGGAHMSLAQLLVGVMVHWHRLCADYLGSVAQALHAFCLADVTLCMPPNDPASFARCLGPYLKVPPADPAATEKEVRRGAERLLCILFIISSLLCKLDRIAPEAAQDLESDLVQLITLHRFQSVSKSQGHTLYEQVVGCVCSSLSC